MEIKVKEFYKGFIQILLKECRKVKVNLICGLMAILHNSWIKLDKGTRKIYKIYDKLNLLTRNKVTLPIHLIYSIIDL